MHKLKPYGNKYENIIKNIVYITKLILNLNKMKINNRKSYIYIYLW